MNTALVAIFQRCMLWMVLKDRKLLRKKWLHEPIWAFNCQYLNGRCCITNALRHSTYHCILLSLDFHDSLSCTDTCLLVLFFVFSTQHWVRIFSCNLYYIGVNFDMKHRSSINFGIVCTIRCMKINRYTLKNAEHGTILTLTFPAVTDLEFSSTSIANFQMPFPSLLHQSIRLSIYAGFRNPVLLDQLDS